MISYFLTARSDLKKINVLIGTILPYQEFSIFIYFTLSSLHVFKYPSFFPPDPDFYSFLLISIDVKTHVISAEATKDKIFQNS